jgi:hypothetical protein
MNWTLLRQHQIAVMMAPGAQGVQGGCPLMPIAPALHVHGPLALHAGMPASTLDHDIIQTKRQQRLIRYRLEQPKEHDEREATFSHMMRDDLIVLGKTRKRSPRGWH